MGGWQARLAGSRALEGGGGRKGWMGGCGATCPASTWQSSLPPSPTNSPDAQPVDQAAPEGLHFFETCLNFLQFANARKHPAGVKISECL